jgi:hypothetical protein
MRPLRLTCIFVHTASSHIWYVDFKNNNSSRLMAVVLVNGDDTNKICIQNFVGNISWKAAT